MTEADATELFHEGERRVQARAGVSEVALRVGRGAMGTDLDQELAVFLAERLFLVAGAQAPDGRVWASLLVGPPGFVRALDSREVQLAARPAPGDPLEAALRAGPVRIGLLALDQATRSRVRFNGTARLSEAGILVMIEEVFGNCPKYIGARVPVELIDGGRPDTARSDGERLTEDQRAFLRRSDTAFIASAHSERGADASHRGGRPGFLEVDDAGRRIVLPDYTGNRMFQTLGNLTCDPRIGMLIVDWDTGRTVQIAGTATIHWDGPEVRSRPRVDRVVIIDVDAVSEQVRALPVRFELRELSRLNPPLHAEGVAAESDPSGDSS
jgi:predicted pyridoxine 5'-phosphate oxidase superfamily flavin-nucleotide-binding protein